MRSKLVKESLNEFIDHPSDIRNVSFQNTISKIETIREIYKNADDDKFEQYDEVVENRFEEIETNIKNKYAVVNDANFWDFFEDLGGLLDSVYVGADWDVSETLKEQIEKINEELDLSETEQLEIYNDYLDGILDAYKSIM